MYKAIHKSTSYLTRRTTLLDVLFFVSLFLSLSSVPVQTMEIVINNKINSMVGLHATGSSEAELAASILKSIPAKLS